MTYMGYRISMAKSCRSALSIKFMLLSHIAYPCAFVFDGHQEPVWRMRGRLCQSRRQVHSMLERWFERLRRHHLVLNRCSVVERIRDDAG